MRWNVVGVACPRFYVPFPSNSIIYICISFCLACLHIITKELIRWFSKQCNRITISILLFAFCCEMIRTTYVFYGVLCSAHFMCSPKFYCCIRLRISYFLQPQKVPSKTRNHLCFALFVPVNYLMGGDLKVGNAI